MNQVTIQSSGETELLVTSDGRLTLSTPIHIKRRGWHKVVTLPDGNVLKTASHLDKTMPLQLALA